MSLKGSIADINLADILQLIGSSNKTGRLKFIRNSVVGFIYFDNGKLIHAELENENLEGESAVYRLSSWEQGEFEFESNKKSDKKTINRPFTTILMEAARIIDEWEFIRKKIPSENMIPVFSNMDPENSRRITLNTKEWVVLSKIDGKKDLETIAYEVGLSIYELAKIFYGLSVNDLVEFKYPEK